MHALTLTRERVHDVKLSVSVREGLASTPPPCTWRAGTGPPDDVSAGDEALMTLFTESDKFDNKSPACGRLLSEDRYRL